MALPLIFFIENGPKQDKTGHHCRSSCVLLWHVQVTVDTASEDGLAKVSELEQHTSRMAQVIQQMESRFELAYILKIQTTSFHVVSYHNFCLCRIISYSDL